MAGTIQGQDRIGLGRGGQGQDMCEAGQYLLMVGSGKFRAGQDRAGAGQGRTGGSGQRQIGKDRGKAEQYRAGQGNA